MNLWLTLILAGLLTFAIRLSFIVLLGRVEMPPWFGRVLRFVPIAVLSAIIAPELLSHSGTLQVSIENTRLLAGILAVLVAWRTRSVLLTIGAGMAGLWILQAIT